MLLALWSPKGGSGTSVLAAACSLVLARDSGGARLADLDGDQPAIFGLGADPPTGLSDWLAAGPGGADRGARPARRRGAPAVALLPRGGVQPAAGAGRGGRGGRRARRRAARRPGADRRRPRCRGGAGGAGAARGRRRLGRRRARLLPGAAPGGARAGAGARRPVSCSSTSRGDRSAPARSPTSSTGRCSPDVPVKAAIARAVDAGVLAARLPEPLARAGHRDCSDGLGLLSDAGRRRGRVTTAIAADDRPRSRQRVHRRLVAAGGRRCELDGPRPRARSARPPGRAAARRGAAACRRRGSSGSCAELADEVSGLGPLEPLLADPEVTEVMLERARAMRSSSAPAASSRSRSSSTPPASSASSSGSSRRSGLRLDRASPMVDARLADGSRLHAVIPPLAVDGPVASRSAASAPGRSRSTHSGSRMRRACVPARGGAPPDGTCSSPGGTSAGKTTLLNALSAAIPARERVVTIEETAELRLRQPHVVRLEARPPNAEGAGGGVGARPGARRAAHATRPHRRRRGARRRGARHAPGAQHRPRRLALHRARQRPARRLAAARDARS